MPMTMEKAQVTLPSKREGKVTRSFKAARPLVSRAYTRSKNDPLAVDAYLATLPSAERESLEAVRALIKDAIPLVEERVSYGTTVMFSLGRDLVGFVSQPKHLSFFMASPKLAQAMKEEITRTHKISGATIHFSPQHPLPTGLLKTILRARVRENSQTDKGASA